VKRSPTRQTKGDKKMANNDGQSAFYESIIGVLKKYESFENKQDIQAFVLEQLADSGCYSEQEPKEVCEEINNTINQLDESFTALRKFKEEGGSRATWLKKNIEKAIANLPEDEQSGIMKGVKTALLNANTEIYSALYEQKLPEGFTETVKDFAMGGINAGAVIKGLEKDIQTSSILNSIIQSGSEALPLLKEQIELPTIKQYFEQKLDSPEDKNIKKVVATAAEIAKKNGFKPLQGKTSSEIAMIVDRGVTTAKLAYKVAAGDVTLADAAEYMTDRAASTVNVAITKTCQTVGSNVGAAIGGTIGSVFGPAGTVVGATVGRAVGYVAGTAVGQFIAKGVNMVADAAKSVARSVCDGVSSAVRSVGNFVSSIFSW
jgi:hypothetical protein